MQTNVKMTHRRVGAKSQRSCFEIVLKWKLFLSKTDQLSLKNTKSIPFMKTIMNYIEIVIIKLSLLAHYWNTANMTIRTVDRMSSSSRPFAESTAIDQKYVVTKVLPLRAANCDSINENNDVHVMLNFCWNYRNGRDTHSFSFEWVSNVPRYYLSNVTCIKYKSTTPICHQIFSEVLYKFPAGKIDVSIFISDSNTGD